MALDSARTDKDLFKLYALNIYGTSSGFFVQSSLCY